VSWIHLLVFAFWASSFVCCSKIKTMPKTLLFHILCKLPVIIHPSEWWRAACKGYEIKAFMALSVEISCNFIRKTEKHHANLQKICLHTDIWTRGLLNTEQDFYAPHSGIRLNDVPSFWTHRSIPRPFKTHRVMNYATIYTNINILVTHNGCYIIIQGSNLYIINSPNLKHVPF